MTFKGISLLAGARRRNRESGPILLTVIGSPDRKMTSSRIASIPSRGGGGWDTDCYEVARWRKPRDPP
jgi:hypothetical protein